VPRLRTYIVEDNQVIYDNLVTTLQELLRVEVIGHARDESRAVQWLASGEPFDLMIVDIYLLSGSGLGVLKAAREASLPGRLVVLTNRATPDIRRRCALLGADRVFDKSCELEALFSYCEDLAEGTPTRPGELH
jgi:DNA-binding NarL/FixJ family response regulator